MGWIIGMGEQCVSIGHPQAGVGDEADRDALHVSKTRPALARRALDYHCNHGSAGSLSSDQLAEPREELRFVLLLDVLRIPET